MFVYRSLCIAIKVLSFHASSKIHNYTHGCVCMQIYSYTSMGICRHGMGVPYPSHGKCKGEMCFNYNIFICQKITKIVAIRYVSQAHIPKQSWRTVL